MIRDSKFRLTLERKEVRKHLGYDYRGKIMRNTLSNQLFGVSEILTEFLSYIDKIVYEWVEGVKKIKIHANPAIDKHNNKLN